MAPPLPWSASDVPHLAHDDTLKVSDVQAKGTHNSYHVETPGNNVPDWHYTMPALDHQLGADGCRQLELDLHLGSLDDADFLIHHLDFLDEETNCKTLRECLTLIGTWSGAHPGHLPIYIQLEPKNGFTPDDPEGFFTKLEDQIHSVLVPERIITPDEVQGSAQTLGEAVSTKGWPTFATTRGRIIFAFDDHDMVRDAYSHGGTTLAGRLLFVDSAPGEDLAAVAILNDPTDTASISAALAAGMIVRTMSDDPTDDDATASAGLTAALASGSTWISTNFPEPVDFRAFYFGDLPGGSPARCNPVTAPASCTSADLEALAP